MKKISLYSLLILSAAILPGSCKKPADSSASTGPGGVPAPSIQAKLQSNGVVFHVRVPDGFHAYVDAGDDGNLIPVSFVWPDSLKPTPELKKAPAGVHDEEFSAKVLRGQADWQFSYGRPDELKGVTLKVRSQICDETSGICYRPTFQDVQIAL